MRPFCASKPGTVSERALFASESNGPVPGTGSTRGAFRHEDGRQVGATRSPQARGRSLWNGLSVFM